ncbi:MAG TPA: hypothetical protein VNN25_19315 [Thermoanaerobaculia bacterium]|nr:hypothetical protein [Thermoanaerobaculia bacterium]
MNSIKRLAASMTGAVAIAALVGTSAFAESRHSDATDEHHSHERSGRSSDSHDHGSSRSNDHRSGDTSRTQNDTYRNYDRGRTQNDTYRNNDRGRTYGDTYRNETRNRSNDAYRYNGAVQSETYRNNNRGSFDRGSVNYRNGGSQNYNYRNNRPAYDSRGRRNYSIGGRINRFVHESGGYRIWVDGGRFPIWIPEARIGLFPRLRVGLSLNFGGYYDPLGYVEAYDYYDGASYGYGYGNTYSSGLLRGVVETVDYRRGTLVLRDDTSGSFVTALIRDRRLESLRPGDYAEISGDWTRNGVFEALRLENVDGGRY